VTAPAPDRSPWPFVALGLTVILAAGLVLGVLGRILSPSVWLDLIALWPLPVLGVLAGVGTWFARGRRRRHLAIVGLSTFTWLALGLGLHLSAAPWLPVAVSDVAGPPAIGLETARLVIDLEVGAIDLAPGTDVVYQVSPIRSGGRVAAPIAYEQQRVGDLSVVVVPRPDAGVFVFGGWSVALDADLTWSLDVSASELDIDLTGIGVTRAHLEGERSRVVLGLASGAPELTLSGTHTVVIPDSVEATVTGAVMAPDGWLVAGDVTTSPAGEGGWNIVIEPGSNVEIVGR
jgi:hypothetical protein